MQLETAAALGAAAAAARAHYDSVSPLYRLLWGKHLHHGLFRHISDSPRLAQEELLRYCVACAKLRRGDRVLDIGCGYGGTAIYLAQRYGCRCTAVTISGVQGRHAARDARSARVEDRVEVVVCDAEACDFRTCAYDVVWVMEASEHFANRASLFSRASAALQNTGRLLLTCWVAPQQTRELEQLAYLCACPRFQSLIDYTDQITSAGLGIAHAEELTPSVAHTWDIVQRRARLLMPMVWAWPRPVRDFDAAVRQLRRLFHGRQLQYWVIVGTK